MADRAIRLQEDISALKSLADDCLYLQGELGSLQNADLTRKRVSLPSDPVVEFVR